MFYDLDDINEKIDQLVEEYGTRDPFRIAKEKGIIVIEENLENIYGYYHQSKRIKFIHVNKYLSERNKLFTACHELGHAILHPDENTPMLRDISFSNESKIEYQANYFALQLMMDGSHRDYNIRGKYDILKYYGLSEEFERYV